MQLFADPERLLCGLTQRRFQRGYFHLQLHAALLKAFPFRCESLDLLARLPQLIEASFQPFLISKKPFAFEVDLLFFDGEWFLFCCPKM